MLLIHRFLVSMCMICIGLRMYGFLEDKIIKKFCKEMNLTKLEQAKANVKDENDHQLIVDEEQKKLEEEK